MWIFQCEKNSSTWVKDLWDQAKEELKTTRQPNCTNDMDPSAWFINIKVR